MIHDASPRLWAITAYYNPVPYRRRLANYRIFRERLGVPLLTVELAYGTVPELGPGDADILVQIPGRDVMWQKERLLNVAVARLPPECDKVVWLDADVLFAEDGWPARLERLLDEVPLAQAFTRVHYLTRDWQPGASVHEAIDFTRAALSKAVADGTPASAAFTRPMTGIRTQPAAGLAWAARRSLLERHGLYDAGISGGGDRLLASAAYRCFEVIASQHCMNERRQAHYRAWADRWADSVGGSIGILDAEIFNQWHGDFANRAHGERHRRIDGLGYDPATDIALDEHGAWRWTSHKPELHAYLRDYFLARQEDGILTAVT